MSRRTFEIDSMLLSLLFSHVRDAVADLAPYDLLYDSIEEVFHFRNPLEMLVCFATFHEATTGKKRLVQIGPIWIHICSIGPVTELDKTRRVYLEQQTASYDEYVARLHEQQREVIVYP